MHEIQQHYGWLRELADIVLVAFIIYRLFLLLKEAMAVRLVAALAFFYLGYLLVQFGGLQTAELLLGNSLTYLLVILVVIFQYEIRRGFISSRRMNFTKEQVREDSHEIIEELTAAAESLASKKIGALIVVERDMSLDNFMAVGTDIDAKVTSEIITSIFLPYSPIHDGAIIIQKGKLTKAGCFLPLTQNPEISKNYGTRHRAAIGLTEVVDAVVLVVSEETGAMSVVEGGRIVKDLDAGALRKALRRLLETRWLQ
jgi:diadenylate cyclase